jgi:drug/metabolite transporter (DMT)-like permease
VETEPASTPWLSRAAFAAAGAGLTVAGVGWIERPYNQLNTQPSLNLAVLALGVALLALTIAAVASFRSLRSLGPTLAVSIMTMIAAVALLAWIAAQPYGD